ncbi:hypothetical protein [Phenylobacterium sp.]|jgi:hypothetical protein|uniref:hypothetical protein n=1 Tax=Phenylobacterium sp. TaxID=1871053 RepID=UPI002E303F05|nr:hypothetical protein [Phenylobacterium sp.]HEX3364451.1 hypothetical protein [Phenylobacterium sp.]
MRLSALALVSAAALAQAGLAQAQGDMMNQPVQAHDQQTVMPPLPTKHDRYLMKLAALREKTIKTKARDGGQLTPEHSAALQRELDELNKQFGVGAG